MHTIRLSISIFALAALMSVAGNAQYNRTAVSVTGLDTNPCTVASPCRTFNYAITQTNSGGEVITLSSGGYGTFTIDRAVSVIAPPGIYAGVTVSPNPFNVTGITVNAPSGANVIIRGLTVENVCCGDTGLSANSGGSITLDHMSISGFEVNQCFGTSIDALVEDSAFRRCSVGVYVRNNVSPVKAVINRCVFRESGGNAVLTADNASAAVRDSISHRSVNHGFTAAQGTGQFNIENSMATGSNAMGFLASGTGTVMRLSNCVATYNQNGISSSFFAVLESFGNNKSAGNATNASGVTPVSQN